MQNIYWTNPNEGREAIAFGWAINLNFEISSSKSHWLPKRHSVAQSNGEAKPKPETRPQGAETRSPQGEL